MIANDRPDVGAEDDQGKLAVFEVLLMADVLIGSNHYVETRRFSLFQQFAVLKLDRPPCFNEGANLVAGKEAPNADGDVLIKQDAQRDDFRRRL